MQNVLIAVDGGGTKTEYCVRNTATGATAYHTFGGVNYKALGEDTTRENLVGALPKVLRAEGLHPEDVQGMVIGFAGCDSPEDHAFYSKLVAQLPLAPSRVFFCNDCELAFRAAAAPPGMCVVAGTGSIAVGVNAAGEVHRCGGWGATLSDFGSGYWLGRKMLAGLLACADGMAPALPVYDDLLAFYNIGTLAEAPFALTDLTVPQVAACAKIIMDRAVDGDIHCQETVDRALRHLTQLAHTLAGKIAAEEEPLHVVLTGSLFKDNRFRGQFTQTLEAQIPNSLRFTHSKKRTSESALALAEKMYGGAPNNVGKEENSCTYTTTLKKQGGY